MKIEDAQKLLRQQIAIARQLCSYLDSAKTRPAELALLQACLLSLRLGVPAYVSALFGFSSAIRDLRDCRSSPGGYDYRRQEILNLLGREDSWLYRLAEVFITLDRLPMPRSNLAGERDSDTIVIATSAEHSLSHWSMLNLEDVNLIIEELAKLLESHCESDQEY